LAVEWRRLSPHLGPAGAALWAGTALLGRRLRAGGMHLFERIKRRLALLS
jgi:hypothetical protein